VLVEGESGGDVLGNPRDPRDARDGLARAARRAARSGSLLAPARYIARERRPRRRAGPLAADTPPSPARVRSMTTIWGRRGPGSWCRPWWGWRRWRSWIWW